MAERAARSTKKNVSAVHRRCHYCNQEGHFVRECPKKERDRLKQLTCFACGGSGHMKRDCPHLKINDSASSPGLKQQPQYSRSSSSPSSTSNALSVSKFNNQRGSDHDWGKGYRLGSASDVDGAPRVVRSYSSVAGNSKSIGNQTDREAILGEHISDDQPTKGGNRDECVSGDPTGKGAEMDEHNTCISDDILHSKDTTDLPSECLKVDRPLRDVQSDSQISGTIQLSSGSPKMTNDCSTSSTTEDSHHSESNSSRKEKPSLALAAVKQSSRIVKEVPEKRKRSHFPPFVDTHCHLEYVFDRYHHHGTFNDFADRHSYPTNFEGCISTFCDPAAFSSLGAWRELLSEPNVWGTFGIHPHNAKYYHTSGLEDKLLEGLQHPKCVAFGEIGLDYSDHSPSDPHTQKEILKHQLQLVVPFGKPVVLHCRDAEQDLFQILTQYLPRDWFIHLHCFTGEPHVATQFMDEFPNLFLGVCGNVTNLRQINMRRVVCEVPLERLLIETDAPYHVPSNLPKASGWCRNSHPALAFYVAKEMAKLRKADLVNVLKTVRNNTQTLYGV